MPLIKLREKALFFIHIPKTGGTTIERNLFRNGFEIKFFNPEKIKNDVTPQHYHIQFLEERLPDYVNYLPFTILRNPWQRTLSSLYNITFLKIDKKGNFFRASSIDEDLYKILIFFKKQNNNYSVLDNHFRPQHFFVSEKIKLYDFNQMEKVHKKLNDFFNTNISFIKEKVSKISYNRKIEKEKILSKETIMLWNEYYNKDIDLYNRVKAKY